MFWHANSSEMDRENRTAAKSSARQHRMDILLGLPLGALPISIESSRNATTTKAMYVSFVAASNFFDP